LRAGSPLGSVLPEWKYRSNGKERHTPDWFVVEGDRLLVIEAKQSVIDLKAKVLTVRPTYKGAASY
jgi:hypothetical protein